MALEPTGEAVEIVCFRRLPLVVRIAQPHRLGTLFSGKHCHFERHGPEYVEIHVSRLCGLAGLCPSRQKRIEPFTKLYLQIALAGQKRILHRIDPQACNRILHILSATVRPSEVKALGTVVFRLGRHELLYNPAADSLRIQTFWPVSKRWRNGIGFYAGQ